MRAAPSSSSSRTTTTTTRRCRLFQDARSTRAGPDCFAPRAWSETRAAVETVVRKPSARASLRARARARGPRPALGGADRAAPTKRPRPSRFFLPFFSSRVRRRAAYADCAGAPRFRDPGRRRAARAGLLARSLSLSLSLSLARSLSPSGMKLRSARRRLPSPSPLRGRRAASAGVTCLCPVTPSTPAGSFGVTAPGVGHLGHCASCVRARAPPSATPRQLRVRARRASGRAAVGDEGSGPSLLSSSFSGTRCSPCVLFGRAGTCARGVDREPRGAGSGCRARAPPLGGRRGRGRWPRGPRDRPVCHRTGHGARMGRRAPPRGDPGGARRTTSAAREARPTCGKPGGASGTPVCRDSEAVDDGARAGAAAGRLAPAAAGPTTRIPAGARGAVPEEGGRGTRGLASFSLLQRRGQPG